MLMERLNQTDSSATARLGRGSGSNRNLKKGALLLRGWGISRASALTHAWCARLFVAGLRKGSPLNALGSIPSGNITIELMIGTTDALAIYGAALSSIALGGRASRCLHARAVRQPVQRTARTATVNLFWRIATEIYSLGEFQSLLHHS